MCVTMTASKETKRTPVAINGVDTPTLFATINAVRAQPELAKFRFRAKSRWVSGTESQSTNITQPAKPRSIMAQVEGSGTVFVPTSMKSNSVWAIESNSSGSPWTPHHSQTAKFAEVSGCGRAGRLIAKCALA